MSYGIKVSKPNISVTTEDPREIILDTTKPLLKLVQEGTGTLSVTGASTEDTDTITHNLGYRPVIMAWVSDINDNSAFVISQTGVALGTSAYFSAISDENSLQLYTSRLSGFPAGDFTVYYKYMIFVDPDSSISGIGSNELTRDDFGILISKEDKDLSGTLNDDDIILNTNYPSPRVIDFITDEIVVSGSVGTQTIAHGRSGIPCFIPYVELISGEWYMATSLVKNLARFITISAKADDENVEFEVYSGANGTYDIAVLVLDRMISGGGDNDTSEEDGVLISEQSNEADIDLADELRAFYSGLQHFQPYETMALEVNLGSSDDIDFDSENHSFGFPPVFTGRYRFKYPDYGNTWSEWLLIPRTPVDTSDFGVQINVTSLVARLSVNQNVGLGGANIDVQAQVMLYPIDLSA